MIQIKTMNAISPVYEEILNPSAYAVGPEEAAPQAILVRSADLHASEIPDSLLCVARAGAGYNNLPIDVYAQKGVVAFNTPGANANAVKEQTVAGLLLASRKIAQGIDWCQTLAEKGEAIPALVEKGKSQFAGPELMGKTLGVMGLGAVGRLVANAGVALGMRVLGHDPYISVENAWQLSREVEHSTDLDQMLSQCDYLSVHVPLTPDSRNLFRREIFEKMKPGAALLNFSRGALVNDADVKVALSQGKLRAYVTDFPNADLVGTPGVVCIPHLGASTPESEENCVRMASRQIRDYLENGSIVHSVNYPDCPLGPMTRPRLLVLHQNIPNVLQSILGLVTQSGENLNIDNMLNKSRGDYACTALDLDHAPSQALVEKIAQLATTYRVRLLKGAAD